ncbi:MAG: hypothetical protein JNK67_16240 [Alphaproteobacteria bacterium]|nr:hypothetical protein [Alphaproteobacteria bacterium]
MPSRSRKTEHAGAKKGQGAFWGPKRVAKSASTIRRRREDKSEAALAGDADRDDDPASGRRGRRKR